uniref:Uncharacterized protein n=1 Tax=Brassica campestris TaxID=3711 RepID=A0A3P6ADS9_BRACM|nr:unnamed protein product [Brassica rapa]
MKNMSSLIFSTKDVVRTSVIVHQMEKSLATCCWIGLEIPPFPEFQ